MRDELPRESNAADYIDAITQRQEAEEHFLTPSGSRDTHIVGGLGLNAYKV